MFSDDKRPETATRFPCHYKILLKSRERITVGKTFWLKFPTEHINGYISYHAISNKIRPAKRSEHRRVEEQRTLKRC